MIGEQRLLLRCNSRMLYPLAMEFMLRQICRFSMTFIRETGIAYDNEILRDVSHAIFVSYIQSKQTQAEIPQINNLLFRL